MSYTGGKNGAGVYQRIISMMPPHLIYVEPFLGGGAVLRMKAPAPVMNVARDLSAKAVADVRRQLRTSPPGMASIDRRQKQRWSLEVGDGMRLIENIEAGPETLVYCDPPYLMSTRSTKRAYYEHEMSDADHRRLLRWAIDSKCLVMISGYWSTMYGSTLRKWRCERFMAMTRRGLAEECVWCNFPEPAELHDYRYLGDGFRERERIKRKKLRWIAKLAAMPLLERRCLLAAIASTAGPSDAPRSRRSR